MTDLNTTTQVISFAKKLENDSSEFYKALAQLFQKDANTFLAFTEENIKNSKRIEMAYYGVITDAIEGCFAFGINPSDYTLEAEVSETIDYTTALHMAAEMEQKIIRFYLDAESQSRSLMADIPRTFKLIAKKREDRKLKLDSLLDDKS